MSRFQTQTQTTEMQGPTDNNNVGTLQRKTRFTRTSRSAELLLKMSDAWNKMKVSAY